MSDQIGFHLAARAAQTSGRSALPDAPVVAERRARAPRTAATLRAVARRSDRLANRLDPVGV